VVIQTVSRTRLKALSEDPAFRQRLATLFRRQQEHAQASAWYQNNRAPEPLSNVAYFSMEFMLSEALPIYSGGLGNVAGDQLKAASDLGVPVVGVGLLYQQGYFRQVLTADGAQRALYPYNDPMQLPVTPVRDERGEWVRLEIVVPGSRVWLRAWQVQVGRVKLYLLDSNDPANMPAERGIIGEFYGGGTEDRLMQELLLGVGGWRLLHTLGLHPEVCHLNEGHAAFVVLERARTLMKESGLPFDVAMTVTRAGNVFTTHTPVAAGFDCFSPSVIKRCFSGYAQNELSVDIERLLQLGRKNAGGCGRAVQYGLSRHSWQQNRQRREPFARGGESAHLSASLSTLARDRSPDWLSDQRHPRPVLGFGGSRYGLDRCQWTRPVARDDGRCQR
jgi:glycogen phosphorylase